MILKNCVHFIVMLLSVVSAPAGLVWHSSLDGDALASPGNDGIPIGTPSAASDRFGNAGGAVELDGSGEHFDIGSFGTLSEGTLAVWAKPNGFGGERGIINAGATGGGTARYFAILTSSTGIVRVDLDNGSARRDSFSNDAIAQTAWNHIAATWDGTGNLRVYIDGIAQTDVTSGYASVAMSNNALLGADRPGSRFWDGCLDDGGVWDEALSARKIAAMHGLAKFVGTEQDAAVIDSVVGFVTLGQRTTTGGETWEYVNGLTGATGVTGGSIAGGDAFIVLDASTGRGIAQINVPSPPEVVNDAATAITPNSARLGGTVTSTGGENPEVTLYYGTTDGGTSPGSWENSVNLGVQTGSFSSEVFGLVEDTVYFHTVSATNMEGTAWASPSLSFTASEYSEIFINEFMASNGGGTPVPNQVPGSSEDWIEILNAGTEFIDLGGWHLTDDSDTLDKWTFPAGTTVPPGGFLVVFASGDDTPDANGNLHTNFKLSAGGEYVALVRPTLTVASEFGPSGSNYPKQESDISYGLLPSTLESLYFQVPTPGAANDPGGVLLVADTNFSHKRGYYTSAISVAITSDTSDASIRYTTDGTLPTLSNGSTYSSPITISTSTALRARAYKTGQQETDVDTQTYIFPINLATQTKPAGYPNSWTNNDYEVDPSVSQSSTYSTRFQEGLRSVPTLALVGDPDDFFGTNGIWANTNDRNLLAAVSAEYFQPDPTTDGVNVLSGFQIDCAAKLQGGASRNPGSAVKHSMSLRFKDGFGPGKLNYPLFDDTEVTTFDSFQLRAMYNNSWVHSDAGQRARSTMIRDQWARESMIDMGNLDGGHGHFAHVYINGLYWGLYNLHERLENDHYAAYNGYDDSEIFGRNPGSPTSEESASYNQMINVVTSSSSTWSQIEAVIDVDNYIDYVIVEYFGRNADLKNNGNWRCAGGGSANAPWRFYCWDTERIFESPSNTNPPSNSGQFDGALIFDDLETHREFRVRFADRAYKHLFNGGSLTNLENRARFEKFALEIDTAIICESARWGDDRGTTYTRDSHWMPAVYGTPNGPGTNPTNGVLGSWFPTTGTNRTSRIINDWEFRTFSGTSDTYLGTIDAPLYRVNGALQHGGEIPSGGTLSASTSTGTVYYTTNGTDPRSEGGGLAPGAVALSGNINLTASGLVRARVRVGGGDSWSPLTEATFYLESLAGAGDLAITEINYNPHKPTVLEQQQPGGPFTRDDFEFIEVQNLSASSINLEGIRFDDGVNATAGIFALAPGAYAVFVANTDAFASRYGGIAIAGTFTGQLSDSGETIRLRSASDTVLQSFAYGDSGPWPSRPDGDGSSLERITATSTAGDPVNWRASSEYSGSPGAAGLGPDGRIVINEVLSHTDLPLTDSIELHNTTNSVIDIENWYLSDSKSTYRSYCVPTTTEIPAGGYVTFAESDFNTATASAISSYTGSAGAAPTTVITAAPHGLSDGDTITISGYGGFGDYNETFEVIITTASQFTIDTAFLDSNSTAGTWTRYRPFALSGSNGEKLTLLEANSGGELLRFVDTVEFAAAFNGEALGRWPNGAGSSTLTPMAARSLNSVNPGPRVGPVIISEINFAPQAASADELEFVELCNTGTATENLANWRLRGGADFNFTGAYELAPRGLLVVVPFDPALDSSATASFRAFYGISAAIPLAGPFTDGPLNNDSGTLRLQRPDSPPASDPDDFPQVTEDSVTYSQALPWPQDTVAGGNSLNRATPESFGNFPTSWFGDGPTPGGKLLNYASWAQIFSPGDPTADPDGDGIANLIEFAFGLNPTLPDDTEGMLPILSSSGGDFSFTFRQNTLLRGITYRIETSPDLEIWTPLPSTITSTADFVNTRTATISSTDNRRFIRLAVTEE